jgi:hypothetical protein
MIAAKLEDLIFTVRNVAIPFYIFGIKEQLRALRELAKRSKRPNDATGVSARARR